MTITVVMPAFNERDALAAPLKRWFADVRPNSDVKPGSPEAKHMSSGREAVGPRQP